MDTLDIIISLIVVIPALLGLKNGFLRSIFSLAGIVIGLFLATRYYDKISTYISFLKFDPKIINLISFIMIIIFCYSIFILIAGKISGFNFMTRTVDKIAGVVFGLLKGLIIASIFLITTTKAFAVFSDVAVQKSKLYPAVINIAPDVYDFVKQFFPNALDFYDELNKIKT